MTDSESLIGLPEVTAPRGGIQFIGPAAEEALRRRAEIHAERVQFVAQLLAITEEQVEHLNDGAEGGHWEYAIRQPDGEILVGGTFYEAGGQHLTAVDVVGGEHFYVGDTIVRRWVPDAGEWGPVKP